MGITSSLRFNYGGIWSDDMGIINVNTQDNGLFQDVLVADREIKEVIVRHRKKPFFQRIQDNPLTLTLRITFEDPFDNDSIRKVTRWLCAGEQYQELYFSDNEDRRFFAMYVGTNPQLQHNGLGEGFMTLTMRCDAPYSYSPEYNQFYDFSTSGSGTIQFPNYGDLSCFTEMWITKFGNNNGDITITNASNGGQLFKFNSAKNGTGTLNIMSNVVDGMLVQIGQDMYEFDTDGTVNAGNIKVSVPSTDLSANTAAKNLSQVINASTTRLENVTTTYSNNTVTVTSNVLGYTMPVDSNYPSICMWSVTQIDGSGLLDQEQVYIDNDNQIIKSSISDTTYRFDAFNDGYLELVTGMNNLQVSGYCQIQFRYRFLTVQG